MKKKLKLINDLSGLMCMILLRQAEEKEYEMLETLWDHMQLSNDQIIRYDNSTLNYSIDPTSVVMIDMIKTIVEKIDAELKEKNTETVDLFYELVKRQDKNIETEYKKVEKALLDESSDEKYIQALSKFLYNSEILTMDFDKDHNNEYASMANEMTASIKFLIRVFVLHYNKLDLSRDKTIQDILFSFCLGIRKALKCDYKKSEEEYVFNTDEKIKGSPTYNRFIKKRLDELSEYISLEYGVKAKTEDDICNAFHCIMKSRTENSCNVVSPFPDEFATVGTADTLSAHGISLNWYARLLAKENTENYISLDYEPDMHAILQNYFWTLAQVFVVNYEDEYDEDIPKIVLSRDFHIDPREMVMAISYAYNMDVICQMNDLIMEKYYDDFSFDALQDDKENTHDVYKATITELQEQISILQGKLVAQKKSHIDAQKKIEEKYKSDDNSLQYEREIERLKKIISSRDEEIEKLKEQNRSQNEYIDILNQDEEPEDAINSQMVDMSLLKSKKYLFVGNIERHLPVLKKEFPNSIFMDTRMLSVTGIKVDAVILLTKFMGHPMYYKLKNIQEIRELPWIYCNTRNADMLYQKLTAFWKQKEVK